MALPNSDKSWRARRRAQQRQARLLIAKRYLVPMSQAKDKREDRIIAQRKRYARLSFSRLQELGERAVEAGVLKHVDTEENDPALD